MEEEEEDVKKNQPVTKRGEETEMFGANDLRNLYQQILTGGNRRCFKIADAICGYHLQRPSMDFVQAAVEDILQSGFCGTDRTQFEGFVFFSDYN